MMRMAYIIMFLFLPDIGLSTLCINYLNLHIIEEKTGDREVKLPNVSQLKCGS